MNNWMQAICNFMIQNQQYHRSQPGSLRERLRHAYARRGQGQWSTQQPMRHQIWKKYEDTRSRDQ